MTKKIVLAFVITGVITSIDCTVAWSQADKVEVSKFKIYDVYSQVGFGSQDAQIGTLRDFKMLAPNSDLLKNDFSGYSIGPTNYFSSNNMVSAMVGIKFRDKQKISYKTNPELRLGITYVSGINLVYGLSKTDRFPYDTLTSSQTGQITYVDSLITKSCSMNYISSQLRLDASLIYRTNKWKRWSLFAGAGVSTGMSFNAYTYIYYDESSRVGAAGGNYFGLYGYGNGVKEKISNKNNFGFSVFTPLGIDFAVGSKREFWKRLHLYFEARPGVNFLIIPELRTNVYASVPLNLGLRVSLHPVEVHEKNKIRDTTKVNDPKKNEIAFSLLPALYYGIVDIFNTSNGSGYNQYNANYRNNFGVDAKNTFRLMYKHYFNGSGIRFGITFNWISRSEYHTGDSYYSNYSSQPSPSIYGIQNPFSFPASATVVTDTTLSSLRYSLISKSVKGVSAGYEYVIGKKKLKQFVGLDVNVAFYTINESTERVSYKFDSTATSNPPYYFYGWRYVSSMSVEPQKSTFIKVGFAPFYGIKYSFSNRIAVSLQTGFEYFFVRGKIKYQDEIGNKYTQSVNENYGYANSVITDVALIYRF